MEGLATTQARHDVMCRERGKMAARKVMPISVGDTHNQIYNIEDGSMPHIALSPDLPGIRGAMAFRPETAKPMNELVEVLLRGPHSLTPGERELIATYVSYLNDCYYCQTIHGAIAAAHLNGDEDLVQRVKADFQHAAVSDKLKALLLIAAKVQKGGKNVTAEDVANARSLGATDLEIHDAVLISAAFCMYNRYVDGLGTAQPRDEEVYRERGKVVARDGYIAVSKTYLSAATSAR